MKKTLIAAALLLGATASIAMLSRKQVATAQGLTVLIDNVGLLGTNSRGTGILLDSTHVLTCAHMVHSPQDEFFVYTYPLGKVYKAHMEVIDKEDDIALLLLYSPVPVHGPVTIATPIVGDEITVIGNALGSQNWIVTHGVISGFDHGFVLTDALINPGNSGGPWLNNKGEVVGMTSWGIGPDSEHHTHGIFGGVSGERLKGFLAAVNQMRAHR